MYMSRGNIYIYISYMLSLSGNYTTLKQIIISNFQIVHYLTTNNIVEITINVKIVKAPLGIKLMTCRSVADALSYCASLLYIKL